MRRINGECAFAFNRRFFCSYTFLLLLLLLRYLKFSFFALVHYVGAFHLFLSPFILLKFFWTERSIFRSFYRYSCYGNDTGGAAIAGTMQTCTSQTEHKIYEWEEQKIYCTKEMADWVCTSRSFGYHFYLHRIPDNSQKAPSSPPPTRWYVTGKIRTQSILIQRPYTFPLEKVSKLSFYYFCRCRWFFF